jgi:hypothetical protein
MLNNPFVFIPKQQRTRESQPDLHEPLFVLKPMLSLKNMRIFYKQKLRNKFLSKDLFKMQFFKSQTLKKKEDSGNPNPPIWMLSLNIQNSNDFIKFNAPVSISSWYNVQSGLIQCTKERIDHDRI